MVKMGASLKRAIQQLRQLRDQSNPPSWLEARENIHEALLDLEDLREELIEARTRLEEIERGYRKMRKTNAAPSKVGHWLN